MGGRYRNLLDKITYRLVADNSIDSSDVEAYRFGLEVTVLKVFHYVSYIAIALYMRKFIEFVVIFAVLYVFRRSTGGFHAKTSMGCYLFSCTVIFLSLLTTELSFRWWDMMAVSILDLIVLLILSPVQHTNRKLDAEDIVYFRRKVKIESLLYLIIYIITTIVGRMYLIELYTIGITMVTLLTIMGKIQCAK